MFNGEEIIPQCLKGDSVKAPVRRQNPLKFVLVPQCQSEVMI